MEAGGWKKTKVRYPPVLARIEKRNRARGRGSCRPTRCVPVVLSANRSVMEQIRGPGAISIRCVGRIVEEKNECSLWGAVRFVATT